MPLELSGVFWGFSREKIPRDIESGLCCRFGNGNADLTILSLAGPDHVQCSGSWPAQKHLCGRNGVPSKETLSPAILITGAKFTPRAKSAKRNQWQRNKYTWKATYYNLVGTAAYCAKPGTIFALPVNWGYVCQLEKQTLQWRHNGCDSVSNHKPHDCLLNRLFRHRWNKTSKLRVTGFCAGNSPVTGELPAQRPVTRKCFHLMTSSWI